MGRSIQRASTLDLWHLNGWPVSITWLGVGVGVGVGLGLGVGLGVGGLG